VAERRARAEGRGRATSEIESPLANDPVEVTIQEAPTNSWFSSLSSRRTLGETKSAAGMFRRVLGSRWFERGKSQVFRDVLAAQAPPSPIPQFAESRCDDYRLGAL